MDSVPMRDVFRTTGYNDYHDLARFSQTQANKFMIDNPRIEHQVNLKKYQNYLDNRLSRPKQSPIRQSAERSPRIQQSPRIEKGSPERFHE